MKNVNVKLAGRAVIVTVNMSVEEIERATKIIPEVTKLTDGKGNEVFRVTTGLVESASNFGFCFVANNADGKAEVTMLTDENRATKDEVIAELGQGLIKLDTIIGQIKRYIGHIETEVNAFFEEESTPAVDLEPQPVEPEQMTLDELNETPVQQ